MFLNKQVKQKILDLINLLLTVRKGIKYLIVFLLCIAE